MTYLILKYLHVLGATVLLGTGSGIAFFMVMAHRAGDPKGIHAVARIVVVADYVFTASAVVLQPITGIALATILGWSLTEGWLLFSILLYMLTGAFWLPVVWMQTRMRDLAAEAVATAGPLSPEYHRLFRRWFVCGIPAFAAVLGIVWLMIAKPAISL